MVYSMPIEMSSRPGPPRTGRGGAGRKEQRVARREIVVLADDLDGTEADVRTVKFGFEGSHYEIDLGPQNHDKLALALAPFISAARKESAARRSAIASARAKAPTAAEQRAFNQRVRDWAKQQGEDVSERGRVPGKLIEAYLAAGLR